VSFRQALSRNPDFNWLKRLDPRLKAFGKEPHYIRTYHAGQHLDLAQIFEMLQTAIYCDNGIFKILIERFLSIFFEHINILRGGAE